MVQSYIDQRQYVLLFLLELNPSPALDCPGLTSSACSEHQPVRGVVGGWFAANSGNMLIWKRVPQNDKTAPPPTEKAACTRRGGPCEVSRDLGELPRTGPVPLGVTWQVWPRFPLGLLLPNMPGSWIHLLRIILLSVWNHALPTFLILENWVPSWPWREKLKMETRSDEMGAENRISSEQHSDIDDKGDWGKARADRGGSGKLVGALSGRWRQHRRPQGSR